MMKMTNKGTVDVDVYGREKKMGLHRQQQAMVREP
jgi:hypothetical protein